jgi:chemotaxis signal transduction protein
VSLGEERGGVLLRLNGGEGGEALAFVPADVALRVTTLSSLTAVPGVRPPVAGIALADGAVVTVLSIGQAASATHSTPGSAAGERRSYEPGEDWIVPGADRAVLCNLGGVEVALTGATVLATGVFDAAPGGDGVLWRSEVVPVIDVRAFYAQAEAATWAERAVTAGPRAISSPARADLARLAVEKVLVGQEQDRERSAVLPEAPGHDGENRS